MQINILECTNAPESCEADSGLIELVILATNSGGYHRILVHLYQDGFDSGQPDGPPVTFAVYEQEPERHGTKLLFEHQWDNKLGVDGEREYLSRHNDPEST